MRFYTKSVRAVLPVGRRAGRRFLPADSWKTAAVLFSLAAILAAEAGPARAAEGGGSVLFDASRRVQGKTPGSETGTLGLVQGPVFWSLEETIDPATYRLLPGDQLHLGLWGETTRAYPLVVTPEGELIIPECGPLAVSGLTLAEAERRAAALLSPLYPKAGVTLRLLSPGRFRIVVTGMVRSPGIYEITRVDRMTAAISTAGGIRAGGSVRRIRLLAPGSTKEGAAGEIDLIPWLVRGDLDHNPLLEPGWTVDVPSMGPTVRVRGPVNGRAGLVMFTEPDAQLSNLPEEDPSRALEWREGDTVGSILELAGGLSERASGEGALVHEGAPLVQCDLTRAEDLARPVAAGDLLEVGYDSRWIFVVGAVRSPGRYPYLPGLQAPDYINLAGGPTELGRFNAWIVEGEEGGRLAKETPMAPGLTVRVPERRSYKLTTVLAPLTSATAFIISVVALARKR